MSSRDNQIVDKLLELSASHTLTQVQTQPTRQDSILDLLFTTQPDCVSSSLTFPGISDHQAVLSTINIQPKRSKSPQRTVFTYSKANYAAIKHDMQLLAEQSFSPNNHDHLSRPVDGDWSLFKSSFLTSVNKYIPTKKLPTNQRPPWMTKTISNLIKRKAKSHSAWKASNSPTDHQTYHNLRKITKRAIRKAQSSHLNEVVNKLESNPKPFWQFIKSKRKDSGSIPTLRTADSVADTSKDKADILNKQFASVFTKENLNNIPFTSSSTPPSISDLTINNNGILKLLCSLNISKASGPDLLPARVLKETAREISPILTFIFSKSYSTGSCPHDWKDANICPVYKKGPKHTPSNYRPVSLTSICCKIFEHILHSHISTHLQTHNILLPNQHGFRRNHSCETQLILTINDLTHTLNKLRGITIDMGILDFSKAFDTVPHERLLSKCHRIGVRGKTLMWLRSFLVGRRQRVLVNGSSSTWQEVISGVPQGTVLGPLLFLIYINDISHNLTPGTVTRLFADDCVIYRPIRSPVDRQILQSDIDTLQRWAETWQMCFNPKKCNIMHISTRRTCHPHPYFMAGIELESVKEHRYLGVTLTSSLSWNAHVDAQCSKASGLLGLLRRNLAKCSTLSKTTAYQALVRPHLEYSASAWDPHSIRNIQKLEQVQRQAARFIFNSYSPYQSVTTLLATLNWQPLQVRRQHARLTTFYRLLNKDIALPPNLVTPGSQRTRSSHPFKCSHIGATIDQYKFSFVPRTIPHWNSLPLTIVSAPSTECFRSRLASYLATSPGHSYPEYHPY